MSRSPVISRVEPPALVSSSASVPSRSSASSESWSATVQPKASKNAGASAHWRTSPSGISGRCGVVGGVEVDPVGGGVGSEAEGDRARIVFFDLLEDQVRRAEQGVDRLSVGALDRVGQGVEGAVEHRGQVDGEQGLGHTGNRICVRLPDFVSQHDEEVMNPPKGIVIGVVAGLIAVGGLAACGDDDESSDTTSTAATLSSDELVSEAQATCKRARQGDQRRRRRPAGRPERASRSARSSRRRAARSTRPGSGRSTSSRRPRT